MSCAAAHAATSKSRPSVAALVSGARALVVAGTLAAALSSCAHAPLTPPAAPPARPAAPAVPATQPKPRPKPGYEGLQDSLASVDASVLSGKKVVLDPGHGGYFTGCIGVGGLTEAEVNLAVAQHLRDLLVAAGSQVTMTRDHDRDYLTPSDSTLRSDLQKRVEIANAAHADLFVSIHHNADPGGLHDVNETQVYYQLGDEGPSYDLANDVMRSLARNVGIETVRLLPGNFYVVRGSEAPALLTESSYLTNPDVEARLRTDAGRLIEAQALYLGVARYFGRKVPQLVANGAQVDPQDGRATFYAHVSGLYDQIDATIDGEPAMVNAALDRVQVSPTRPLAIGTHAIRMVARLGGEGTSRALRDSIRVRREPRTTLTGEIVTPGASMELPVPDMTFALRLRALDNAGLPRPESIAVRIQANAAAGVAPRETTVVCRDGIAWAYLRFTKPGRPPRGSSGTVLLRCTLAEPFRSAQSATVVRIPFHIWQAGMRHSDFALQMPQARRLIDAPGTTGSSPSADAITRDGFVSIWSHEDGSYAPCVRGMRRWGASSEFPPRYTAIAGGVLWGKRIVLDPEGGGDDAAGIGRTGTRAATLNLDVARALAAMLRAAGADVALTRDGDAAISEVERVQIAEGFKADRYLRIGHAAAPPVIGHYFSSAAGTRWGQRVAETAVALGMDSVRVADVAKYALTQASAVALYASLGRIDDPAAESRLLEPGAGRREAYVLYAALLREFAPEAKWAVQTFDVRSDSGAPQGGAPVRLGGALVLAADSQGRVRYLATEQGPMQADYSLPGAATRVLLLDSPDARKTPSSR
jgi:N-acetylmuramoyl-L-alanine amidase